MSLHADALAVLRGWSPPDDGQADLRERYVACLETHPEAMTRACRPDHLTASTLVLDTGRTHVLLTLHTKARRWFQFGGHAEPGDTTLAGVALREALEESGLGRADLVLDPTPMLLDAHPVPFCGPGEGVRHLDVMFVAVARTGVTPAVSEESIDVRWWAVDDLPDAELVRFVGSALRHPGGQGVSSNSEGGEIRAASDQPSR